MVAVPVTDRRERHAIEVVQRGLDRTRGQAELLCGTAQRPQTRAIEAGVHELPDPRERNGATEVAGDHREARRPTIHLVDLTHESHAPHSPGALHEAPLVLEGRLIGGALVGGRLIDLLRVHLDLSVGPRRQQLALDSLRCVRPPAVVVLRDALVETIAKLGKLVGKLLHRLRSQREQTARRGRFDRCRSSRPGQRRRLAEILASIEVAEVLGHAVNTTHHADAPCLDEVHRSGRIAFRDDHVAGGIHARLELGEDNAQHRLWWQARKCRKVAEEVLQCVVLELQLEIRADVGVRLEQLRERHAIEPQREDIAARADGSQSRAPVEELGLAEAVAGMQDVERNLGVLVRPFDDARTTADEDVDGIGNLPFRREDSTEGERHRYKSTDDARAGVVGKKSENGKIVEDARFSHPASARRLMPQAGRSITQALTWGDGG